MQRVCKGVCECERVCESGGECVRVGVSACAGLKVCNSVSLGAVWGFCIEVSVQGACKGCVRVCKSVQEWGECERLGVSACVGLKVCNSVNLGAVCGLLHRDEFGTSVQGVCEGVQECARVEVSV